MTPTPLEMWLILNLVYWHGGSCYCVRYDGCVLRGFRLER